MDILKECTLCHHNCKINRYKNIGFCGAGIDIKVARCSLHYYEEPIISGCNGSGAIFFSNCNLKCLYCQNKKISTDGCGKNISIERFSDICIELQNKNANNINLVTPTMYVPQIIEGIKLAKDKGLNIPVIYNTSSYENVDTIKMLDGTIDVYLPDLKYYDDTYANNYSKVKDYFKYATLNIDEMYKQVGSVVIENNIIKKGVIVRVLVLPGLVDDSKRIIKYLYDKYKDNIYISIMNQYTPVNKIEKYDNLNRKVTLQEYDEVINYACDLGIVNAFIQEGDTQDESFIPDFDFTGV